MSANKNNMTVAEEFVCKVEREARSSLMRVYAPMILLAVMTIGFSLYDNEKFIKYSRSNGSTSYSRDRFNFCIINRTN